MTHASLSTFKRLAGASALALLLTTPAFHAALAQGPLLISMDPVVDISKDRSALEDWRKAEQQKLRQSGRATVDEFRRIDQEMLQRARALEAKRADALKILSEKSGFSNLGQGPGGTQPSQGRGILGDIDTMSLTPREYDKALKAAEAAGYKPVPHGDGFKIPGLDVTVHRAPVGETVSPVGSSGRAAEIARGNNPETALGLGRNDPAIAVSDNLKKAAHTLNTPAETLINNPEELQKLGKMTGRNLDAISSVHGEGAPIDPALKQKADLVKQGYSPEAAGIVDPAAPPAEQAKQMAEFQKQCKGATIEAVKAGDTHAGRTMDKLAGEVRDSAQALEAAKASGNPTTIAEAQARATNANKAIVEYSELRTAANHSANINDPEAAKIVNEARGVKPEGSSPSQVREAAAAAERKTLSNTVKDPAAPAGEPVKTASAPEAGKPTATGAEPVKPTTPGAEPVKTPSATAPTGKGPGGTVEPVKGPGGVAEPVKAPGAAAEGAAAEGAAAKGGLKGKAVKGAGILMAGYMIYHGITRGAEEAGKEAAEKGDSALTSTAKTAGYSLWHGLGFGSAVETGKKAGEESAQKWAQDVKDGKIDPNSKLEKAWAQIRAVGWGVAEFTGLQAIKDATVEGAGLVKDKYGQYQAEKAAAAAQANKPADAKTGDAKTGDAKPGDAKTADTKPADAKPATTADKDKPVTPGDKDKTTADKTKPGDAKTGDAKTGDAKTGDAKTGDAKTADGKDPTKDPAAADKDKTAGDKDRKPPPNLGGAITAAGVSTIKATPPKPPVSTTLPAVQPLPLPPPPPPPPTTTEVEGGWLQDSKGKTKVVYIQNEKGERIGGYYVHYDPQGRETGRETFSEKPDTPTKPEVSASLSGGYRGQIGGKASGSISFSVSGASISGTVNGVFEGDSFTSHFSGSLNPDGSFNAPATGVLQGRLGEKVSPYPFSGHVTGRISGGGGTGTWSGRNQWGGGSGTWQARK